MEAALIFPHQLFKDHPALTDDVKEVYLVEDHLFFNQYTFHKKKLLLHRASMKYYELFLQKQGRKVHYIEAFRHSGLEELFANFEENSISRIHTAEPVDYLLQRRLKRFSLRYQLELTFYESTLFLTPFNILTGKLRKTVRGYLMANFYKEQRKHFNILMEGDRPTGGKWSFDEENRKRLPKNIQLPPIYKPKQNMVIDEAKKYVDTHFKANPGDMEDFIYPVNHEQALQALEDFLEKRMGWFGDYEDAIAAGQVFLFHSILTPALNIGLITPQQVVQKTLDRHLNKNFPLNSLEGFIRQIIGWREFMRGIYEQEGVYQRTKNHFAHRRKIPDTFWTGETGIEPVDSTIKKVLKQGYCHHIERLMVLGNFMLLCEFDPDDVYRWFMELFIDAYDWVMVPNVYGMSQYADGGLLSTKPYLSGSNYILKMSDYKKGPWCEIWDALYWRFLFVHKEEFSKNQRMSMMINLVNRMDKSKLEDHLKKADSFLGQIS